ncbi:MAG: LytR C-terminal domain-containing protein [Spirochaetes bacterium]|nr:LytR C-terminal domain-containing protein [Spirochaetota bacterium]
MRKKIIIVILIVLLLVVFLFLYNLYKKNTRNIIEAYSGSRQTISILIAGSNVFNENRHSFYCVLTINPENSRVGLTFIPPEFRVMLDPSSKKYTRIKDVDINDFKSLSASLQRTLKLHIPFYVVLYSPDVERMVDLIEGVNLYTLNDLDIPGIEFGLNYFDGSKINRYINSVEGNSIYRKFDRIQTILLTLYSNKDKYNEYFNPVFISEVLKSVKTNLLAQEILSLTALLNNKASDFNSMILPGYFTDDGFYVMDDIAYKIYKTDFLKKLIVDDDSEQPIKIKILNSTEIDGLARKVRRKFVDDGFNVVEFGNSPFPALRKSVLINRKGAIKPVLKAGKVLNIDNIYHIVDSSQLNDVLLIIGLDLAGR